jgi:septal ring factor EnvC (AmiA/AmiB activator)
MRGLLAALLLSPALAASALAQEGGAPLDTALKNAEAEQAAAEAETAKLEEAASRAKSEADRLRGEELAAAQAIEAGEARITAADDRFQFASASVATYRRRLAAEQQPVSSLLAGLATMAGRPPLMVLADHGSTDELVEVRLLLDSTLPVIRSRTSYLSAQIAQGERLQRAALAARAEILRSRDELAERQRRFAALEQRAAQQALASGGQALGTSDVAIAASADVERLKGEQANNQSMRRLAAVLADGDPAPPSPFAPEGGLPRLPAYQLPAIAAVTDGLGSIDENGVRSRGITLATPRGAEVTAPADGTIKYSGPFRDFDGVVIIDHGGGWLSLIVNAASQLHPGDHVSLGQEIGRALGPLEVELSQNGRRISPALIAGSSQNLSKGSKGG